MKVYLGRYMLWPVYGLFEDKDDCWSNTVIEVPEELYREYREAVRVFEEIQNKIVKIKDGNS